MASAKSASGGAVAESASKKDKDGTSSEDMEGSEGGSGRPCQGGMDIDYVVNVWWPRFGRRLSWMIVLLLFCHGDTNVKIKWDVKTACNQGKTI